MQPYLISYKLTQITLYCTFMVPVKLEFRFMHQYQTNSGTHQVWWWWWSSSSPSCSWRVRSVILFLNPQDAVGPSTSSSLVPCSFVLSVYIVMLVLVVYLCPSSVRVVATFSGIVLFPLLHSVLLFFPKYIDFFLYLILLFKVSSNTFNILKYHVTSGLV